MTYELEHWPDEIITEVIQGQNGLWYATLDTGPKWFPSDPDYSTCSETSAADAVKRCAARIRAHGGRLSNHDIHYRYGRYWEKKGEQP